MTCKKYKRYERDTKKITHTPKHKCIECNDLALWHYEPWSENKIEKDSYYCDACVSRGCDCNINPETNEECVDTLGRKLPCCEYGFSEDGFDLQ